MREVELVLLHRGRAMDFAVGLLPFQDGTSPLLALSVASGVVGAVDLVWMRRGYRERPLGGVRGRFEAIN